ncbi:putative Ig domain-containing protein [Ekhidna sp.]
MQKNRFYHWVKLQRKYRNTQKRLAATNHTDSYLAEKLDRLSRRIQRLNRKWKIGVSTAALAAWLMVMPNSNAHAQFTVTDLPGVQFFGENGSDRLGSSVSSAGDVNGDGFEDIIISAPNNRNRRGAAYVVFGSDEGITLSQLSDLDGSNGFKLFEQSTSDYAGTTVSSAGDINGDGISDVMITARNADRGGVRDVGAVYVVFGSTDGFDSQIALSSLDGSNGFTITGTADFDRLGADGVSSVGDINGDGIDDIIMGSRLVDINGYRSGAAYVLFGSDEAFDSEIPVASLDGTNGFTISGKEAGDELGQSVSGAGDINGDGINDIIVGAPRVDINGNFDYGATYVVFGSNTGFGSSLSLTDLDGTNGFEILGVNARDASGYSVSGGGDVNGDGFDDMIIGASARSAYPERPGSSFVVFGGEQPFDATLQLSELDGSNGFRIAGVEDDDFTGISVHLAGDVNGDGLDDLLIGAKSDANGTGTGTAYVLFGTNQAFPDGFNLSGINGINGYQLLGEELDDEMGRELSSVGDVNGDGIGDLLIGVPNADPNGSRSGTTYVVYGRNSTTLLLANLLPDAAIEEGTPLTLAVPENTFANPAGTLTFAATLANGDPLPGWLSLNATNGTLSGTPGAEDVGNYSIMLTAANGIDSPVSDTFSLTVSSQLSDPFTSIAGLDGTNGFKLQGDDAIVGNSGTSVSDAGDINGDGFDDFLIGAPETYAGSYDYDNKYRGATYLVFGDDNAFDPTIELASLDGTNGFKLLGEAVYNNAGSSVSRVGDVNGDGFDDLFIAGGEADNGNGKAYIVLGKNTAFGSEIALAELDETSGVIITAEPGGNRIASLSGNGDINGDGFVDIVLGSSYADYDGTNNVGATYIIFGSATGFTSTVDLATLDGTNGFKVIGETASDNAGRSVSIVNINGDAFDDVVIGANGSDINGNGSGTTYIVFGGNTGFSNPLLLSSLDGDESIGFKILGEANNDNAGRSVSNAGDVNGDGLEDLVIGATGADTNGSNSGTAYVIFGSTTGFGTSLNLSDVDGANGFKILGETAGDNAGRSVSNAGDVNGDGVGDFLIGANYSDQNRKNDSGAAYLIFGRQLANPFPAVLNLADINDGSGISFSGENEDDNFGNAVSGAGDVNGDGFDDLLIGASGEGPGYYNRGSSYIIFGKATNAPVLAVALPDVEALTAQPFSYEISSANFVDPDGNRLSYTATLADGGDLPAWLTLDEASGTFSGTPANEDFGTLDITVTAADGLAQAVSDNFTLVVKGVPFVSNALIDDAANEGEAFSYIIPANAFDDPEGAALTLSVSQVDDSILPAWLSFDADTDELSGTPGSEDVGTLTVKVTATDPEGLSISDAFDIVINGAPIVANSLANQITLEQQLFEFIVPTNTFEDPEGETLTLTALLEDDSPLPAWLSFDGGTQTFSGTPANTDIGTLAIKVTATDSEGLSGSDTFNLIVSDGTPGVIIPIADQTANEEQAFTFMIPDGSFVDPNGDELTLTASLSDDSALPAWLSFDGTAFSGTPASADVGELTIRVTATDPGTLSVSDEFTLTVNGTPTLENALSNAEALEGVAFTYDVPASTFDDPEGSTLTLSATLDGGGALPAWLAFDGTSFSGTPGSGDVGVLTVSVTATDPNGLSISDDFILTVNGKPVFDQALLTDAIAIEGLAFSYAIPTGAFIDPEDATLTLTAALGDDSALPAWLSFDGSAFSGTPQSEDVSILTIKVTATDPEDLSTSGTFELIVSDGTPILSIELEDQQAGEGQAFTFAIPDGTFVDPNGGSLTFFASLIDDSTLPGWLSLDAATGVFSGTPGSEDLGTLNIRVTVTDPDGLSVSDEFTLTVNGKPVVANALPDAIATEGDAFSYTVPGNTFTDPEEESLELIASLTDDNALPDWLSFSSATGTFTGTPGSEDAGTLIIKVAAVDPGGLSMSDEFILTVNEAPLAIGDLSEIAFYPNPVKDELIIEGSKDVRAFVTDLQGKSVTSVQSGFNIRLSLSHLDAGIYVLIVEEGTDVKTHKIIKN